MKIVVVTLVKYLAPASFGGGLQTVNREIVDAAGNVLAIESEISSWLLANNLTENEIDHRNSVAS